MVKLGAKKTDGLLPPVTEDDTIHMSDFVYLFGDVDRSLLAQGPVFLFYKYLLTASINKSLNL